MELDGNKKRTLRFIGIFLIVMLLLAGIRHIFDVRIPSYDNLRASTLLPTEQTVEELAEETDENSDSVLTDTNSDSGIHSSEREEVAPEITVLDSVNKNTALFRQSGKIWNYDECFADTQQQHIYAAKKFGIRPVDGPSEVLSLASRYKLVSIKDSPFFILDKLKYSTPYLVPSAKELLDEICINFLDSLSHKGHKLYLPIVSSVLRTKSDVAKLRKRNRNATDDSCHGYGTTFDITYSRFMPLTGTPAPVDSATWIRSELKLALAEVIYDLRLEGKCFVKHEKRQPCFHITVRR